MPHVYDYNRQRARQPKTRTGCVTCKARRVKCDEAKPACRKCTAFGRRCGGYEIEIASAGLLSLSVRQPSSALAQGTAEELHAADLFLHHTARQLVGSGQSEFWNRIVLQAVHSDSSVRPGALALASIHRDFELIGDVRNRRSQFAYRQYDLAIRDHLERLSRPEGDAQCLGSYLISCVLFVTIEMLHYHCGSAVLLIRQAAKLLSYLSTKPFAQSLCPLNALESVICRLQAQAIALMGPKAFCDILLPRSWAATIPPIPLAFISVDEARTYFDFYRTWHDLTVPESLEVHDRTYERSEYYHDIVRRWTSALTALEQNSEAQMSHSDVRALNVMKIRAQLLKRSQDIAATSSTLFEHEDAWDCHLSSLKEILDLCAIVVHSSASSPHTVHSFTLDLDIIAPLYDIARMCRDPRLRRRAIDLLRQYRRREGLLDSALAARIADRVVELEEGASKRDVQTAADVPGWARLRVVVPSFRPAMDELVVRYYWRHDSVGSSRALEFEEVMHW